MARVSVPWMSSHCRITRTRTVARSRTGAGDPACDPACDPARGLVCGLVCGSANPSNTAPGSRRAISSNRSAAPSGRRRSPSQACTSCVLTLRNRANTACEARSERRKARSCAAFTAAGAVGSTALRRSRGEEGGIYYNVAYYAVVLNAEARRAPTGFDGRYSAALRGPRRGASGGKGMVGADEGLGVKLLSWAGFQFLYIVIIYTSDARQLPSGARTI